MSVLLNRVDHSYNDKQKMAVTLIMTMKDASKFVSWGSTFANIFMLYS